MQQFSLLANTLDEQYPAFQSLTVAALMSTTKATQAVDMPISAAATHP